MKKKKLLIAVDMQNDFMNPDGKLYVQGSEEIKPNIKRLFDKAYGDNSPFSDVLYTKDWHEVDDAELSDNPDFKTTFPPHCMANTDGADVIKEANPNEYENTTYRNFLKDEFSVFTGNRNFESTLVVNANDISEIYVGGVSGDVCVFHLLEGLIRLNKDDKIKTNIYVIKDVIASLNPDVFEDYLERIMEENTFIYTTTVDEIK